MLVGFFLYVREAHRRVGLIREYRLGIEKMLGGGSGGCGGGCSGGEGSFGAESCCGGTVLRTELAVCVVFEARCLLVLLEDGCAVVAAVVKFTLLARQVDALVFLLAHYATRARSLLPTSCV